jgi:hypothetical protein
MIQLIVMLSTGTRLTRPGLNIDGIPAFCGTGIFEQLPRSGLAVTIDSFLVVPPDSGM